ncbi:hypothetical protein BH09SUM1_BH09SUM1_16450 [soil metagenome]
MEHANRDEWFRRLIDLHSQGKGDHLFTELLRQSAQIFQPLYEFLDTDSSDPRCAILVTLLGKCMDPRGISMLLGFLEHESPAIRRAAANALGWNRARVALEALEELEINDPEESVRHEAQSAIDEILVEFPKFAVGLKYHVPTSYGAKTAGGGNKSDAIANAIPRILSAKYRAIPLRLKDDTGALVIAVQSGTERRLIPTLTALTGRTVELEAWPEDAIKRELGKALNRGDDDFCAFENTLTDLAREELSELILSQVRPGEPGSPLSEAHDAVEAAQIFLATAARMNFRRVQIIHEGGGMLIDASKSEDVREGENLIGIAPPPALYREKFLCVLRILAGLRDEAPTATGHINCHGCDPAYSASVTRTKRNSGETLQFTFVYSE